VKLYTKKRYDVKVLFQPLAYLLFP